MWSRHKRASELLVVLLRGNVMFGKNALTGRGKCAATSVADLVIVKVYVRICRIGTNKFAAQSAGIGASVIKGMTNVVKCRTAVLALSGAGIKTNVTAIGVNCVTDAAVQIARLGIGVFKTGFLAANCADVAALFCGSRM